MSEEVDISGCRYYRKDKNCDIWGIPCQMKEFCYFKILKQENAKLKEELAEANQLKDMYHTYYRAKHDDIKGIIFKQKEKLEKIKEMRLGIWLMLCGNKIKSVITMIVLVRSIMLDLTVVNYE